MSDRQSRITARRPWRCSRSPRPELAGRWSAQPTGLNVEVPTGADSGGGRWGGCPSLGRRGTIQDTQLNSIQAPVQHWVPSPGRNSVSAPDLLTRGRHCLIALPWAKIVDFAVFKLNGALSFTRKAPLKDARVHVHDAPHHPVSFSIEQHSWDFIGVPI